MRRWNLALIALLVLDSMPLRGAETNDEELADAVLVQSATDKQLAVMADIVLEHFSLQERVRGTLPAARRNQYRDAVRASFEVGHLRNSVRDYLSSTLSESELKAALEWLKSPMGQHCTRLESIVTTPEGREELERKCRIRPKDRTRMQRSQRLERAVHGVEGSREAAIPLLIAVELGFSTPGARFESIAEEVRATVTASQPKARPQVEASYYYLYHDLSYEDLDLVIGFFESSSGAKYAQAMSDAMENAVIAASRRLATKVGVIVAPTH